MFDSLTGTVTYRRIIRNLRNSIYFFLPSILQLALNLVTSPIFARNLSYWDFSAIGYFNSIQQFFVPVLNLSMFQFYMKGYHQRTEQENKQVMSSLVLFTSMSGILMLLFGTGILWVYFNLSNVTFPLQPYVSFVFLSSYFNIFTSFIWIKYKMERSGRQFFILRSILILLSIALGLLFVVTFQWGAKGRLGATMAAQALVSIWSLRILLINFKINFRLVRSGLKFGYPLILVALLNFPISYIDRILLEKQNDVIQFGLYNIGVRMAGYLFLMGQALFQAFEPDFYKYASDRDIKQLFLSMASVFGFLFLANLVFSLFSKSIISLLTSGIYTDAYQYANLMIWSNFFLLFSFFFSTNALRFVYPHPHQFPRIQNQTTPQGA